MADKFRTLVMTLAGAAFGLTFSIGSGVLAQKETVPDTLPWDDTRLLAEVLQRVRQEYVEPVDDSALIESAVRGMVTDLDPHSQFLSQDEYEEIQISTKGNYSGIGLEVNMEEGRLLIVAAVEGAPAERAGLRAGDSIISIDGTAIDSSNIDTAAIKLRGKAGTSVEIMVEREGEPEPVSYTIERSNVELASVRYGMLAPDYGYIRITHFSEATAEDTEEAAAELQQQSRNDLKGIVLDLRNNPGGVLESAVAVADSFLDSGTIVSASGRAADANFSHAAREGDLLDGAPIIVLVNEGSASAAEIVAGALQDNHRAEIAGMRTFGKGSVQTVMPLSNGRAIKLTTSRYFTPSGQSIQDEGIAPDVEIPGDPAQETLAEATSHRISSSGKALLEADSQLRAAYELLQQDRILHSKAN
jgi:carboxyl-terminal processing protease